MSVCAETSLFYDFENSPETAVFGPVLDVNGLSLNLSHSPPVSSLCPSLPLSNSNAFFGMTYLKKL